MNSRDCPVTRAVVNVDIAVMKPFGLPWEGHRLQFRGEAFNAFNRVNLYNPILNVYNSSQFEVKSPERSSGSLSFGN